MEYRRRRKTMLGGGGWQEMLGYWVAGMRWEELAELGHLTPG